VPQSMVTDVGLPCPAPPGICMSGDCQTFPGGGPVDVCSAVCGGAMQCPSNGLCVSGANLPASCFFECSPTVPMGMTASSSACQARNPATPNCLSLGLVGTVPVGICTP
jgi:hypothetical protein